MDTCTCEKKSFDFIPVDDVFHPVCKKCGKPLLQQDVMSYYPTSITEQRCFNRMSYSRHGGRGRPRKTDYCTIKEIQGELNKYLDSFIVASGVIPREIVK